MTTIYTLVKVDYDRRDTIGVFATQEKAEEYQSSLLLELFDSGSLAGVSFDVEEWDVV